MRVEGRPPRAFPHPRRRSVAAPGESTNPSAAETISRSPCPTGTVIRRQKSFENAAKAVTLVLTKNAPYFTYPAGTAGIAGVAAAVPLTTWIVSRVAVFISVV